MNKINMFSKIFLMMPSREAAECLLLLEQEEKVLLLVESRKNSLGYIPKVIAENNLPSLGVFEELERKLGEILMNMAEVAGDKAVYELLSKWADEEPVIIQELRRHIFFFEEIMYIENRTLQLLLREQKLSPLMLVDTSSEVRAKLLANVSQRIGRQVSEEFEVLQSKLQDDEAVYRVKGQFCQLVIKMLNYGEIESIEYPLPEITTKAFARDVNCIAENILRMTNEELYKFLRENLSERLLKVLLGSEYAREIKERILPFMSGQLKSEVEGLSAQPPQRVTMETVQLIKNLKDPKK